MRRKPTDLATCPRCGRFCRWRTLRYERRSACCWVTAPEPEQLGPLVVEIVRELEIGGERFAVAIARPDIPVRRAVNSGARAGLRLVLPRISGGRPAERRRSDQARSIAAHAAAESA